jgi:diguanylate cyclase (GGDEF)-like protein
MVVAEQEMLRLTLPEPDSAAKTPSRFPEALPAVSEGYYRRIESYAQRIRASRNVSEIVGILDEALTDTRALHGTEALAAAEDKVRRAELEIETLKAELERAVALTNLDPLTNILNRRGLESSFAAEAARSDRHAAPLCAALLDVDDFKRINDTRGHAAGDAALIHLAQIMRASLRPNDVLARVGGEEFLILLPDTNERAAFAALSRLQKAVAVHPVCFEGSRFTIGFTASVALRAFGESLAAIGARLDEALYRAKNSGKNRVMFAIAE